MPFHLAVFDESFMMKYKNRNGLIFSQETWIFKSVNELDSLVVFSTFDMYASELNALRRRSRIFDTKEK